ncbi:MAG: hydrolase [Candidatus Didemnitutus sp.]|nr:hydrolase [Candidatus Didemnitutus sp.]
MSLPASIVALVERQAELAALLEQWCNLNSGSGHAAGLERMRRALREEFARSFPAATIDEPSAEALGFNPTGVKALRVRVRPTAPIQILLSGHYDTVYESGDAFQTCRWIDADTINGPGVADMKGGLVTLLAALQAFEQTPHAERIGWEALITPDEETGSHGSEPLFVEAAARHHFAFIFEPARPTGDAVHSRKGTGNLRVTCHGRAAHAAKVPNDGRNAILALAEYLLAIGRLPGEMPGVLLNVGNIRGGGAATNVVPDFAEAEVDVRITKVADREPLLARLHALAAPINARDGLRLELQGGFNRPPKECLPAEEAIFKEWQRAGADLGVPAFSWVHAGGGSDGNLLTAAGLPNLDGIGPIGDHLHSNREYCRVNTIAPRAQLAALFLHRLASGEIALPARS